MSCKRCEPAVTLDGRPLTCGACGDDIAIERIARNLIRQAPSDIRGAS